MFHSSSKSFANTIWQVKPSSRLQGSACLPTYRASTRGRDHTRSDGRQGRGLGETARLADGPGRRTGPAVVVAGRAAGSADLFPVRRGEYRELDDVMA